MAMIHYRRGKAHSADMAMYMRQISEENTNSRQLDRLKHNLVRCLREDVTERQRTMLMMYYVQRLNQREIGQALGVDKSTVSKTIKRGERRLRRCLRYGAESYLRGLKEETE